nr:ATP-binding protein [uncultured Sphingomonas sp.]
MSRIRRFALPDTILGRTLALTAGTVLLLTAINLAIIFLRTPPRDAPLNSSEVARLLQKLPIAKNVGGLRLVEAPLRVAPANQVDDWIGEAVAQRLRVAPADVQFRRTSGSRSEPAHIASEVAEGHRLYSREEFDPIIFNGFVVTARLPGGITRSLVRQGPDAGWSWQLSTAVRMLLAFFLVLPVVWLFARALALPIRAFAASVDRVGREPGLAPVAVKGPAEIRLAAQAVNEMQDRLNRYHLERTGVVGAIAHDLRTPLARLRFHLADAPDPMRSRAEGEIDEMQAMVTATMEFVQHETRPRASEPIDLALLVEGLVDDLADLGRPVHLDGAMPATVRGDALLLKRLFNNLIGNAVSYGNQASVTVRTAGDQAIVTVVDKGPGLSEAEIARAFEPFWRAEGSRNRATGGIGLGLAIVRGAARAHGGDVTLSNRAEGGLKAEVLLPLA